MISSLSVITLALVLAIVLLLAYHLIGIFVALKRGADHLEKLAGGLGKVRDDTRPLNTQIDAINAGLSDLVAPLLGASGNLAAIVKVAQSA
jgi:hypothetical protein